MAERVALGRLSAWCATSASGALSSLLERRATAADTLRTIRQVRMASAVAVIAEAGCARPRESAEDHDRAPQSLVTAQARGNRLVRLPLVASTGSRADA